MDKLIIIADDLTGACEAAVHFAGKGITTLVLTDFNEIHARYWDCQVLAININSRHDSPEMAKTKVKEALLAVSELRFTHIYKKTDSALRGNIGAELEASLQQSGFNRLHFVPAHPAKGRYTKDGIQYVGEKPLHQSDFGKDPLNPMSISNVNQIIKSQSDIPVLKGDIRNPTTDSSGIFVYDTSSIEDLKSIADYLNARKELHLCAGPAGMAALLPDYLNFNINKDSYQKPNQIKSLLVVNGSLHPMALSQVDHGIKNGFESLEVSQEALYKEQIPDRKDRFSILFTTDPKQAKHATASQKHLENFARIASRTWKKDPSSVLCVFGGDTLMAILKNLEIRIIRPIEEIKPDIVLSAIEFDGKERYLVTKPGSYGKRKLLDKLQVLRTNVR